MVYYMTLSIGLAELLATVVCVSQVMLLWECITVCFSGTDTTMISVPQSSIIERLGRKTLIRGGYFIMGSLLAVITVTLSLQVRKLSW